MKKFEVTLEDLQDISLRKESRHRSIKSAINSLKRALETVTMSMAQWEEINKSLNKFESILD